MYNTVPDTTNVNPIFSSYKVRSANFNENMDEFVKADNDIYIEEQKKKKPAAKTNINADAINGIPDMPEFLKEQQNEIYKMPEWLEKLNVCSPDEIEEWKKKGGMGIAEAWEKNNKWASFAPYINTTKDAADAITVSVLLDRAKKGQELTYEQQEKLVDYLRDMKELQVRGFTFGGGTVNAILSTIPYLEEFGIGLAASGEGVGLAALGKTLSTIGAKKAARKAVEAALKEAAIKSAAPAAAKKTVSLSAAKKIYKDTLVKTTGAKALANVGAKTALKETGKALPSAVATSAKFGLTKMPETFLGGIADRQIATGVYVTDYGDAVFTSSEHLATSIMKSLGDSTFEALTETAGWTFSPVAGYFAKPIQKVMPKKFFTGFEKLVSSRYGMPAAEALRKYGYDGVIEEMGEELLNRFLCQTFGINGLDEYNFDGFMNNVLYANNPSQWAQEALSFAAVGGAGHIAAGANSRVADAWNKRQTDKQVAALTDRINRYIQSPEQFYLEQGLIKIKGSQSLAEQKLRDIWTSQNIDESLQDDILKNMSETEIRSELKNAIENKVQDVTPEAATEKIEKELTNKFVENKTFANEKDAKSVAALFSAPLQKLSEVTGLSLEEVMEEEMPEIQREAEQAARENGRYIQTDGRIEEAFKEFDNLPEDFDDMDYINNLLAEIDILTKVREGGLEEKDYQKVEDMIKSLDAADEKEFANELRELTYNQTGKLFQAAYHGTPHDFDNFSTQNIGSGEGAQAHGWGLYFAGNKDVSDRYRAKLVNRSMNGFNEYTFSIDNKPIDEDLNFFLSNNLSGGVLYNAANSDNEESQKEFIDAIKWHIDYLRRGDASTVRLIKMLQEAIDKIENNPKLSITKFLSEVPEYEKYRFKTMADVARREAKEEGKKANIQYLLKWIKEQQKPFLKERNKQLATLEKLEKLDVDNIKISRRTGQLFEVDIPEDEVLLDEQKTLAEQSETVKQVVFPLLKEIHGEHEISTDAELLQNKLYEKYENRSIRAAVDVLLFDGIERDELFNMSFEDLHSLDAFLYKGRDFYKLLSKQLGSDKLASEKLNELGIKGITYNGLQDGRCYVIFDDNSIDVLQKYYQGATTNYKEQFEDIKANRNYKQFVNKVLTGTLSQKEERKLFEIGKTPDRLIEAGIAQNNLTIGASVIRKAQNNKNSDHNLSEKTISEVYAALKNPIAVIKAEQNKNEKAPNNRYSVVLDLKDDAGKYVLVAIDTDKRNGKIRINDIRSIHSRENYTPIIDKAYNDKRLIKVDADKIKGLLLSNSDIISEGVANLINSINQQKNKVKLYQAAYNGSPNNFDEFSTDFIGSGEGAQAHGWGLYFAENRETAEGYRNRLRGIEEQTLEGANKILNQLNECIEYTRNKKNKISEEALEIYNSMEYMYENKNDLIADLQESIDKQKEHINHIKQVLKEKGDNKSQVYKVDIPDANELLDEDKELIHQPDKVQRAIEKIYADAMKSNNVELTNAIGITGKEIYRGFSKYFGSDKKASEFLNSYGIKGITYDGRQDGRCYVVFDDKAVKVLEKYYQGADDAAQANLFYDNITPRKLRNMNIKGAFVPAENLIELFKNADESTIIHEFAHWWLSRLEKYAQNNDELALDLDEVRKFVKNNGEAFTREQHEKFAVGFEAYIRNGSARSNRLKRIFEDFKNALIQIYDSIRQLVYTEGGEQYSFSEADVANLEKLFERLLTTENERIRKTVFDRCDDINDRIKEIKANQENEMKELDELWKDNIAINNRKSDKKRKVQEYLDLAESAVRKVPKEVREMKERYKNATIDILSAATGLSRKQITNARNLEKVQMALENADDRITVSGGMRAEWMEFYADTGVNYDTDEIGGDYDLAEQAFKVFADGTYNFNDMNEDEIGDFYGKFDYLYHKVQSLKGEEKTVALEALYSLFGDMPSMPDEVVSDLVEKLGKIETEYEEGQKEDFNRKTYPSIPVVQQLQMYVTLKLDKLKVYDPNVRYKVRISKSHNLYKTIKYATSVNATKRIVRQINDYVIADLENQAKSILHKEIQKQIRVNSKLVKVGTLTKGKFDWKTNTVFAELAQINKLKQKEALKEYGAIIELDKAAIGEERENNDETPISTPEFKTDFQSNLRRKFLEYRSSKIKDLNLLATRSLLEDIMTLKFEGRRAKDAEELEKQLQKENMKTDLAYRVRLLKGNKAAQSVAKFIMGETALTSEKTLVNWETALNALFGREVAQRYSLLKLESDAEVYAYKHYADFCQKALELYGLNNPVTAKEKFMDKFNRFVDFGNVQPLIKLMQEYEEEVYNFREVTFSKETGQFIETGVQLSRAEIITLYAWSMNEELEQRIMTQYGLSQVRYMFDEVLSDEDKQLAWLLIDTCEAMYDENNEVFIRTMGLSLPKVQNYFPSKTVRVGSEIDMLHENIVRSSNPSFIKQRKTCNRIKMKPEQPISILLPHINKTARYVILSERLNYLNAIFKDATVRAAIKEVFDGVEIPFANVGERAKGKRSKQKRTVGDRIHDTLLNQLGSSTFENYVRGLNTGKSWADVLAANYITSRIGGNAKVMFGQLTSVINYAEKMPVGEWSKGFVEALKTPKETFKYMLDNCDYLKARLAGNSMNEIMSRITDETDRFRTLRNFCATNTKYGDILAISFGGKPYIDYLIKQGMSEGEAFDKFVEDTLRAQQSGHNSATSVWQKKMSENFFTRMMFAFNNTSLQYERKFLDAVSARTKGEIGNKDFIKAVLLYKVFNPIIFTSFLGNLSLMQLIGSLMRGDDDDNIFARFGIDAASAMVFANMGAYGFAGMGISTLLQFLMTLIDKKEYKPFLKTIPIISDVEEIGKDLILKDEVTFADWVETMALVGDDATGVPVSRLTNAAGGIGDIAQGEAGVGMLRMLGYGNYRSHVAATGEPPKKNKKKR